MLALLSGLDDESIHIVSSNIRKLRAIMSYTKEKMWLPIYTPEELRFFNEVLDRFNESVLMLSDDLFYCNGYLMPTNKFEYCVFGDKHGIYKLEYPEFIRDRHIMDVGACIGDSAIVLSPMTDKQVHSFEPNSSNCDMIYRTVEINKVKNVVVNHLALTSEDHGKCVINLADSFSCCSISKNDGLSYHGIEEIDTITLDTYVKQNGLEVGLIKVDVEGAEQDFLKGAMQTIITQKPTLIISIYHNSDDFFDIKPMLEKLDLGYRFKVHRPMLRSVMLETVLIAEVPH